jgi:phosphoribosylaminoimidazolecarboxamide formyltransferase/IMP cyclohydrolase
MEPIRRALLSVSDKRGLVELARGLERRGVALLSTGGTARALRQAGLTVTEVAEYTGAPEILDGRVKTLHPRIHAGLLARPTDEHRAELARQGIEPIDLVVVNLYPFRQTVARADVSFGDAIENIDVGGPTMLRAAAKNFERVAVAVDPDDYAALLEELERSGGALGRATRFRLARKAFAHTAAYDAAISNFLDGLGDAPAEAEPARPARFPATLTLQWTGGRTLRYGENPHQQAAFYVDPEAPSRPTVAAAEVLQGKELSYNNLLDLDAALGVALELERPAAAIIKHNNPCGVAQAEDGIVAAYLGARACDPVSAFGGVVAVNRPVDEALAQAMGETFLECVIAPGYSDGAREVLAKKKNLRVLAWRAPTPGAAPRPAVRSIAGGLLVEDPDAEIVAAASADVVTKRAPTPEELRALDFAWRVCKHVRSNAIVFARAEARVAATVGIGAGQMSRVDSVRLASEKAQSPTKGCVMASDAFFPFRDGVDAAAKAGITAVIQPGGSVRDAEVIAACDEQGLAMVFTKMRHFKH